MYSRSRTLNNMKKCRFFVVPGNGHSLLGVPDTDPLNIIKINIHTIGAEQTGGTDKCHTNRHTFQQDEPKQETVRAEKCCTNMGSISKSTNKMKPMVKSKSYQTIEYFLSGLSYENNKKRSAETTRQIHKAFEDVFNGTFSLQLKPDSKPYQVPLRYMAYALQKPFKEELERLQKQDIIAPLGVDETSKWCNSFV